MKVCAIKNINNKNNILGYLFHYERENKFVIELKENIDCCDLPYIPYYFYNNKQFTIYSDWSNRFVYERIIPRDRQNISSILSNSGLSYYDEWKLLILNKGKCCQDNNYIEEINVNEIPEEINNRRIFNIDDCILLKNNNFLIVFKNKQIRKINIQKMIEHNYKIKNLINHENLIKNYEIDVDGYGILFLGHIFISSKFLYDNSTLIDLEFDDLKHYINERVINSQEASEILNCSRQNINDLVKRKKIEPLKITKKGYLFFKKDIENRI